MNMVVDTGPKLYSVNRQAQMHVSYSVRQQVVLGLVFILSYLPQLLLKYYK